MFLTEVRRHNDEELHAWAISLLTDLKNAGTTFTAHYIGYGQWTFGDENEFCSGEYYTKMNATVNCAGTSY